MTKREPSAAIDATAAHWAVRVDSAPLAPSEQADLDAWLAGDTRRLGAYARARAMLAHARRTKALGPNFDPELFAQSEALAANADGRENDLVEPIELPSRRRFLLMGSSAAAAASAVGLFGWSLQAAAQTYSTKRGEIRLVPLDDGSSVTLNTVSTVTVRYDANERQVELVQGEALFDVAKDPSRPFVVAAGDTSVRAVGTSFSVRRFTDAPVEVVVRTGSVDLIRANMRGAAPQRLSANTRTIAAGTTPPEIAPIPPDEVSRALAWREGMLSFEDMPLAEAAQEFARYSDLSISFADPAIAKETVTGLYAANNPAGFARAVASTLDLKAVQTSNGVILSR